MRENLQSRCTLFIENRDLIKSAFKWENGYIFPICASIYASKGMRVNVEKMLACREILRQKTGVFSYIRGTSKMATVSTLALSDNPGVQMDRIMTVYEHLKGVFTGSAYLPVAAAVIADLTEPHQYVEITQRTRMFYDRMKSAHPFLTGAEESTFAALLAMSELDMNHLEREMEQCYTILKPSFFSANAVQSLSQILALGAGDAKDKCAKTMEIFEYLKNRGCKYGTGYELSTLGVLALLDEEVSVLADDILSAENFLKQQKGFGAFGVGSKQRIMYAGMLTMCDCVGDTKTLQSAALNGVVSLVIAQQVAMCSSIAAASAVSSSSGS